MKKHISKVKDFYTAPTKSITNSQKEIKDHKNKSPKEHTNSKTKISNAEKLRRVSQDRPRKVKSIDPEIPKVDPKVESNAERLKRLSLKRKLAHKKEGNQDKLKRLSLNYKPRIVRQSPRIKTPKERNQKNYRICNF